MKISRILIYVLIIWFMTGCTTVKLAQYATTLEPDPSLDARVEYCDEKVKTDLATYKENVHLTNEKLSKNEYIAEKIKYDAMKKLHNKNVEAAKKQYQEDLKNAATVADAKKVELHLPASIDLPEPSAIPTGRKLDSFMNCFFEEEIAEDDLGRRLLRGHYIVAALARYGATSVMAYPIKPKEDATNILRRIEHAEKLLKTALSDLDTNSLNSGAVSKVDRVLAVQELVADSMKPFNRNATNWFESVFSAIQGNPFKVVELAQDTGEIIKRTLRVKLYGNAFRKDIGQKLKDAKTGNITNHWNYFDTILEASCATLGSVSGVKPQCIAK